MKIIIVSDSHGNLENMRKIKEDTGKIDMVIHLGDILGQDDLLRSICDCPAVIVRGNCDFYSDNAFHEIIPIGNNKIFATHGHMQLVDFGLDDLKLEAEQNGCNIALYGHTHVPDITKKGKIMIVNPGSISKPRQLDRRPTYAVMKVDKYGHFDIKIEYVFPVNL